MVQQGLKVVPVILFFLTMNFPSALTFYWLTTNIISVTQAKVLRIEGIRELVGIPKMIKWDKKNLCGKRSERPWITGKFREKLQIVELLMPECLEKQEQHDQRKHLSMIPQNLKLLVKLVR